jgi:glutamyl-tRNA(Gln) amidotransferase subunit D
MEIPTAGNKVKIKTKDKEYEGILMPRAEILDKDIVTLKLNSGYNIGIKKEKITNIKIIEEYQKPKKNDTQIKIKKELPKVIVFSYGGTIASKIDYKTGGVVAEYTAKDMMEMIPEINEIANIESIKLSSIMSEDMNPKDWINLAKKIHERINEEDVKGIVVTQGTDTLHYTTAALSFFLKNLKKTVIVSASQRSIDRGSSDAFMNLMCSINAAANSKFKGVFSCLHATTNDDYCYLINGTRVRKLHSSKRDAFKPVNAKPLAKVWHNKEIEYLEEENIQNYDDKKEIILDAVFEQKIGIIYTYPGMDPNLLDNFLEYKGLIVVATGLGNVQEELFPKIKKLRENKVIVLITTQTLFGATHRYVYRNLRQLSMELGCIFVDDMHTETAYVKLGYVLAKEKDRDKIENLLLTNMSGEILDRI